jgi:ABC-2 type transport system ATP-binding protein
MSDGASGSVPAISARGLRKVYRSGMLRRPRVALETLDLDVPTGTIFGFVGHNGAGKTTSIKLLMGLSKPTAGQGTILGQPLGHRNALARIGFLPERPYFYDYLTGREFLDFYGRLFAQDATERRRRADDLLARVELTDVADDQLRTYSKGMLQRVGVAQALINQPDLVVLDEPMSGLDPSGRRLIRNLIVQMRRDGRTVFFSSHILSDVELICDQVGILIHGRLRYTGSLDGLLQQYTDRVEICIEGAGEQLVSLLPDLADEVTRHGQQWLLRVNQGDPQQRLLSALSSNSAIVVSVTPLRPTLEELFVRELSGSDTGSGANAERTP